MFERFTDRARRVVVLAQEEARLLDHNSIGSEHLLLGLIHEGEGVAAKALERCDVSLADVRTQVESIIGHGGIAPSGHIPFTPRAKTVLELSLREAMQLGHNYIGTEHILLALIREGDGVAAQVLAALGLELSHVRTVVVGLLQGDDPEPRTARGELRTLEQSALVTTRSGGPRPAACSFCGVPSPGSGQLFTGTEGALICRQCAQGIVGQVGPRTMRVGPSTPGPFRVAPVPDLEALVASVAPTGSPPDDEDAARAEVERVFLAWGERSEDGVGLVNVEDGGGLGPYLDDIQQRYSAAQHSSLVVDAIVFVDATEAAVFTTTLYQGSPLAALQHKEGRAVLVDGSWLTTRQTIAERLAYIGVHVPPRAGELPPEIWRISSASFGVHAPTRSPGFVPPAGPRQFEPPFDALAARHEQTGPPPDDEVAARAAIEAAFRNLNERTADGRGLVNVEHGEDLGAAAARVEDRVNAMATRTVNVAEHVTFLDADHAVVWLTTVLLDGRPLLGPIRRRECRAVLVDGRWKVVYESVRELWALADVQIPPFGEPPAA